MYKQANMLIVLCAVLALTQAAQQTEKWAAYSSNPYDGGFGYYEYLPDSYNNATADRHPVIFFMHGQSEMGNGKSDLYKVKANGIPDIIDAGNWPSSFNFIVFSPQECCWWSAANVKPKLKWLLNKYPKADRTRVYLTGLSLGGGGTWEYPGAGYEEAMEIAAIVPVCGQSNPGNKPQNVNAISSMKQANLPVWAFHNSQDNMVATSNTDDWINQLNAAPGINPVAKKTIYPVSSPKHDAWTATYNPAPSNPNNIYAWMLNYSRPNAYNTPAPTITPPTSAPTNPPPTSAPTTPATQAPTTRPTSAPTSAPTSTPTTAPTKAPTSTPTSTPTNPATSAPTTPATQAPTTKPTSAPTKPPTGAPTSTPGTAAPTSPATPAPTGNPTDTPTFSPITEAPTSAPTSNPVEDDETSAGAALRASMVVLVVLFVTLMAL